MKLNGEDVGAPAIGEVVAHATPTHGGEVLRAEDVPPGWLLQQRWAVGGESNCAVWYPDAAAAVAELRRLAGPAGLEVSEDGMSADRPEERGSPGSSLWVEPVPADGRVAIE